MPLPAQSFTANDWAPMWSGDGRRLFFMSNRTDEEYQLYVVNVRVREPARLVLEGRGEAVSPDGRYAVANHREGVWALPLEGAEEPRHLLDGEQIRWGSARLSPDGRWLAYVSGQTGREEIYVVSLSRAGRPLPVSPAGGRSPRWRGDSRELFYVDNDFRLMSVSVSTADGLSTGEPRALFALGGALPYEVSPDGQRFLVNVPLDEPDELKLFFDWSSYLPK